MSPYAALLNSPCESVRRLGDAACGRRSKFLFRGIDPSALALTAAERKKYIRTVLLMCEDCAKALIDDFAWQIQDGKVKIERLEMVKHRLHCRECSTTIALVWPEDAPVTNPGEFAFCPRCGAKALFHINPNEDYWEIISETFENMPVELVKLLYVEWPRSDRRFPRFADYVRHSIEEFDATGELPNEND